MSYVGINPNKNIEPFIEIRPESSYPKEILKQIHMLSINKDESVPFGSMVYRLQKYPGDIDIYETYMDEGSIDNIVKKFAKALQKIVKNIIKTRVHYYSEVKAGIDWRYDIDIGNITNGIYTPSANLFKDIQQMFKDKLFNKDEYKIMTFILNQSQYRQLDDNDYEIIKNIFREKKILRWTAKEILAGKKKLIDGKIKSLIEALEDKSYVKLDMLTVVNGRFIEVTNFYILAAIKGKDEDQEVIPINLDYDFLNVDARKTIQRKQLKDEIEKLYFSDLFYSPFKMLKRMYALGRSLNDTNILQKVVPFVSSNTSSLYQIKSEIDTIILVMERSKSMPIKTIDNSIDFFKPRLANVIEIEKPELEEMLIHIDQAIRARTKNSKIKHLKQLKELIVLKINYETINYLNKVGLNPPPENYLPSPLKYKYFIRQPNEIPINPFKQLEQEMKESKKSKEEFFKSEPNPEEIDFIEKNVRFAPSVKNSNKPPTKPSTTARTLTDDELSKLLVLKDNQQSLFDLYSDLIDELYIVNPDPSTNDILWYIYDNTPEVRKIINKQAKTRTRGSGSLYQTTANFYRKNFCNGKSRSLKDGEYHLGCHNFTGPGTRIDLEEVRNYTPYNNIDGCSKQHDIDYLNANGNPSLIRKADEEVIKCYNKYPNESGYNAAKLGINTKMKLENAMPLLMKSIVPSYFGKGYGEIVDNLQELREAYLGRKGPQPSALVPTYISPEEANAGCLTCGDYGQYTKYGPKFGGFGYTSTSDIITTDVLTS
jgi:hypothetical protein